MADQSAVKESNAPLPIPPEVHSKRWWILLVLCTNLILVVAANSGLVVGLPSIARQLGASQTQLQWLVDVFIMAFAGSLMPMGAVGDRFGRKRALLVGLAIYAITSLAAQLATSVEHLFVIRGLMGVGAGLVMPATLSLITTAFVGRERNLAVAIWSGCAGAGAGIGLLMSGSLLLYFDWNSIFLANVPIALIGLGLGLWLLVESKDPQSRAIDWIGSGLVVLALWSTLFGIIELPIYGFFDPAIMGSGVVALVLWGLFILRSRHTSTPLVEVEWFRDRRFSVGSFSIALMFFALMGWFFLSTQLFQYVFGMTPFEAAFAGITLSIVQVVFAQFSARWVDLLGTRIAVMMGMILVVFGLITASFFTTPNAPFWPFIIAQVFIGLGLPWASSPATSVVLESLPPSRIGAGSAVNGTVREIGAALGVAVIGSIATSVYRAQVPIEGLSNEAAALAKTSLAGALSVADQTPNAQAFIHAARLAFGESFRISLLAGSCILCIAIVMVLTIGFTPREEASLEGR